ncbi:MAG: peptide chain release factor N(5)-glutamine methyltransferase [Lachnospiraceae bacterium]|nr:peptide chain release factor N(5)-glutamine methyltransferase [Lachnospiraceae bacterium]
MTYNDLIEEGVSCLKEAGIDDAKTDAAILLEHLTGMDRKGMLMHGFETPVPDGLKDKYRELLIRRSSREPVQYITGMADFMGLRFQVNENVLIPRFDTEFLVEELMRDVGDGASVLDMCTGSGCILLSLMSYKNGIRGAGADISKAALEVAAENERTVFKESAGRQIPVDWILSDMFEGITGKYDYIVSNPPYIQSEVIDTLMSEVKDHEPRIALDGDSDGLRYYRIIAGEAGKHLNRYGKIYLETGYDEAAAVGSLLKSSGFTGVTVKKDYSGNDRVVMGEYNV